MNTMTYSATRANFAAAIDFMWLMRCISLELQIL